MVYTSENSWDGTFAGTLMHRDLTGGAPAEMRTILEHFKRPVARAGRGGYYSSYLVPCCHAAHTVPRASHPWECQKFKPAAHTFVPELCSPKAERGILALAGPSPLMGVSLQREGARRAPVRPSLHPAHRLHRHGSTWAWGTLEAKEIFTLSEMRNASGASVEVRSHEAVYALYHSTRARGEPWRRQDLAATLTRLRSGSALVLLTRPPNPYALGNARQQRGHRPSNIVWCG